MSKDHTTQIDCLIHVIRNVMYFNVHVFSILYMLYTSSQIMCISFVYATQSTSYNLTTLPLTFHMSDHPSADKQTTPSSARASS